MNSCRAPSLLPSDAPPKILACGRLTMIDPERVALRWQRYDAISIMKYSLPRTPGSALREPLSFRGLSTLWTGCGNWQRQFARPFRVMKYPDIRDSCSRNVLVSNATACTEILLVVGRVQRGNRLNQQNSAGGCLRLRAARRARVIHPDGTWTG